MVFIGIDHHKWNNLLKGGKEQAFLRDDRDYLGSDG